MSSPGSAPRSGARLGVWIRRVVVTLLLLGGVGFVGLAFAIRHFERGLPSTAELRRYSPPQTTRILARDGTLLGEDFVERRTVVALDALPSHVRLAFLAAEDASFYEHKGLDYAGIARAFWVNLRSGSSRQGASTITQQVIKNVLLTQERTLDRKVREVLLARRIEQELTKDELLELYLNHIYFGHGRYGVEEAAKYYFGKPAAKLTLGEAALLASVPKGPSYYNPRDHLDRALERRGYVLAQMVDKGFAKEALARDARTEPVALAPEDDAATELAPEVLTEARRVLRETVGEAAERGGYTITTTIDPRVQAAARKAIKTGLGGYDKRQRVVAPLRKPKATPARFEGDPWTAKQPVLVGEITGADDAKNELYVRVGTATGRVALASEERYNPQRLPASRFAEPGTPVRVSVVARPDPKAGGNAAMGTLRLELGPQAAIVVLDVASRDVLAIAGSYGGPRGGLDRASSAFRQPGSSFKPFVYAQAIATRRFTPASLVPTSEEELEGYKPKNHDRKGGEPVRLREALTRSVNVASAWLLRELGAQSIVDRAHALGIRSKLGATPSLALGAYEVSPRELAAAYATIAGGGVYEAPRLVSAILGPDGEDVPLPPRAPKQQALEPAEAYVVTSLMTSVVEDGTGKGARVLKRPIAGKTGTSNEARDAWFAGFSTEIAASVWVGFDDRKPLGGGESGGVTAVPLFVEVMRAAHQGRPATDFVVPPGIVRVAIDPKTGKLARPDQPDALSEVFLEGTAPTEVVEGEGEGGGSPEGTTLRGEGGASEALGDEVPPSSDEPH